MSRSPSCRGAGVPISLKCACSSLRTGVRWKSPCGEGEKGTVRRRVLHLGLRRLSTAADYFYYQSGLGFEAFVFVRDVIDLPKQIERLEKEAKRLSGLIEGSEKKLANERFISNAPTEVVEKERAKLAELSERKTKIASYIGDLS